MQKLSLVAAALGLIASAAAQNCNGSPPPQSFAFRDPFAASFYYGPVTANTPSASYNLLFDAVVQSPITITSMLATCYDQFVGNAAIPNQVGNTTTVNVYTCPITRVGNTGAAQAPGQPGSTWTLIGSGTLTVAAWPTPSPIAFTTPIAVPAGTYGVAIEVLPTTVAAVPGNAIGSLHCLGVSPSTIPTPSDPFLSISNQGIQQTGWVGGTATGVNVADINLVIDYIPDPQAALFTTLGEGCYFRPRGFFENFPAGPAPDLANTAIQLIPLGQNYLVAPVASSTIAQPTSTSITAVPANSGSSGAGNWDDGLSAPITLPFTFAYPGGSTTTITISSNGSVYLDAVNSTSFDVCGAAYGSLTGWRDNAARIAPMYMDLDPSPAGGGTIHYDVDPSNQFVTITWYQVPEWPAALPNANTFSLTLWATGQVDINYNALTTLNTANGNNAIAGFTEGNGNRLPASQDLSVTMPFQSGDGAIPPVLGMSARPVIGTTPNIVTTNITAGTTVQLLIAGLNGLPAPIDLTPFGLPGCNQHIQPFATLVNVITPNNTFEQPFAIPVGASYLQNVQFFFQAAPLTPGLNQANALTTNGICTKIGL